ncbi:unnamed protein product, partial [Mesorhabditis spiculigera]
MEEAEVDPGTYSQRRPARIFLPNATPIPSAETRTLTSAVKTLIDLCDRGLHDQSLIRLDQLNVTRACSHVHFHMWRRTMAVFRAAKKVLPKELKTWLQEAHKGLSAHFQMSEEALNHLQARVYEQLYRLETLHKRCMHASEGCMDYLDLGHWQSLSMVLIAIAADIFCEIKQIVEVLLKVYSTVASIKREEVIFPDAERIGNKFHYLMVKGDKNVDYTEVEKILKISQEQVEEADIAVEVKKIKGESRANMRPIDLGVTISRENFEEKLVATSQPEEATPSISENGSKKRKKKKLRPSAMDTSLPGNGLSTPPFPAVKPKTTLPKTPVQSISEGVRKRKKKKRKIEETVAPEVPKKKKRKRAIVEEPLSEQPTGKRKKKLKKKKLAPTAS